MESDLPNVENIDFYSISRIKKLFYILSERVPFMPNISQLSQFEIGCKNKSTKQIKDLNNADLALDGLTTGYRNEIPLWLFGFLY